ncbi:tungstate ABC transporter ATP-binding protein WtpC [Acetohalobium arabaticum]|uniref:ABC-type quaternary amine transporter n=1 Tax=Acetohalobium arabaticum (strain ATCC 49924 / DSM 5501 / Z-7288) TaxID=574087 RepID=D9QQR9_ACEAZ|nr:tungstate ABC transporter ATP-binding protein WtpC [Acetohalobium arabaticum]ADL12860.1 molybdate ABC transporter, ATPase subunit [Acetohalobium arabaticum DSM 5501]
MIKLENISKDLGDFKLKNIDLELKEEEYFTILGPTGTGKSILLEVIAGLQQPEEGDIWFEDELVSNLPPEDRQIGMVYQDYMLFPHLDVKENILFGLKLRKESAAEKKQKLQQIVSLLGINDLLDRSVKTLSGGEKQRVALARALIISPKILLLDEPLSALDPSTKNKIQQDLKRVHTELGTTTLHVTHDFNEALSLADRIAIMQEGEIVQVGSPQQVFKQPESNFIAEFVGSKNIFVGQVVHKDDRTVIKINEDIELEINTEKEGDISLIIRPEDIIISHQFFNSSARNSYQGVVKEVKERLSIVEVKVDIGIEMIAYITYRSLEEMGIEPGKEVYLTFKATACHVIKNA